MIPPQIKLVSAVVAYSSSFDLHQMSHSILRRFLENAMAQYLLTNHSP